MGKVISNQTILEGVLKILKQTEMAQDSMRQGPPVITVINLLVTSK
jgi:hypothetical protein